MKYKGHGIIWDAENNKPLCEFIDGEITTDNERTVEIMNGLGHVGEETASPFDNMSIEELKAYAEVNGIDIGQSTSQKGILKKIVEATKTA